MDLMPGLTTDVIDVGHVVGLTPHFKFREVYYTRGIQDASPLHRETFLGRDRRDVETESALYAGAKGAASCIRSNPV